MFNINEQKRDRAEAIRRKAGLKPLRMPVMFSGDNGKAEMVLQLRLFSRQREVVDLQWGLRPSPQDITEIQTPI